MLILGSTAQADLESCKKGAKAHQSGCDSFKKTAKEKADAVAAIKSAGAKENPSQNYSGDALRDAAASSADAFDEAIRNCKVTKEGCEKSCPKSGAKDATEQAAIDKQRKSCENAIQRMIAGLTAESTQNRTAAPKAGETAKESKSSPSSNGNQSQTEPKKEANNSQPMPPPPAAPPQQQAEKPKDKEEAKTETASASPAATPTEEKKKEEDPKTGFAVASETSECKKVPKTAVCEKMELQAFCADSKNSKSSKCAGQIQTASVDPSAIPAAGSVGFAPASAGGGGGGAATGGATGQQSLVDANKLRQLANEAGTRDGKNDKNPFGNMSVDGGGGFGAYGAGPGGSSSDEDSNSSGGGFRGQSVGGRSVSSLPEAANATDIEKLYGPSVVHILSDNIKRKCDQGRFMHCEPKR